MIIPKILSNSYISPLCFAFSVSPASFPALPISHLTFYTLVIPSHSVLLNISQQCFSVEYFSCGIFLVVVCCFFNVADLLDKPTLSLESLSLNWGTKGPFSGFCGFWLINEYIKILFRYNLIF